MQDRNKKTKKQSKARDLKPTDLKAKKDAKGGAAGWDLPSQNPPKVNRPGVT